MTLFFLSLLLLSLTTATPLIHLDLDYESFLKRSNPTWKWGSSLNKTGPTEWVSSLFGGNGNLGYQLYSPTPTTLQLDISSKLLWDDRTPDLVTPPSISKQNLTYYTGNFVKDQPRLPSGHFIITWNDNQTAPILAVGHMSLYNARAELNITTSTSGTGFSLVAWVSAAYEIADVVVVEIKPFGNNAGLPSVTFVPADTRTKLFSLRTQSIYSSIKYFSNLIYNTNDYNYSTAFERYITCDFVFKHNN